MAATTTPRRFASQASVMEAERRRRESGSGRTGTLDLGLISDIIEIENTGITEPETPSVTSPEVQEAKRKERELARRRRGRRTTILTGPSGLEDDTGGRTLLGG